MALRAYADKWLDQRHLRPCTRQHYESMLERLILPGLGDAKLATLAPVKIRQWHAELGADHPTCNAHAYALLHAICATVVQDEVLDANPCRIRAAMQTQRKRDVEVLTPAQVDRLAAKMPANLRASVLLAAWCGLRWGETSELRRKDFSKDCAVLGVRRAVTYRADKSYPGPPKTAAGIRYVAIPPTHPPGHQSATERPRRRLPRIANDTNRIRNTHARRQLPNALEKARAAIRKPTLRVHGLRHVGAVLAAQSYSTTAELMHRLGRMTPQMTLRYQHVAEGRDADIAERLSKLAAGEQK